MEHNQFAVYEQSSESDHSSLEDNSTVIPVSQSDQVILERGLSDQVRYTDRIFRKGERYSARGGVSSGKGSQYREPETTQPQTSTTQTIVPAVVSKVGGAQALPKPPAPRHQ